MKIRQLFDLGRNVIHFLQEGWAWACHQLKASKKTPKEMQSYWTRWEQGWTVDFLQVATLFVLFLHLTSLGGSIVFDHHFAASDQHYFQQQTHNHVLLDERLIGNPNALHNPVVRSELQWDAGLTHMWLQAVREDARIQLSFRWSNRITRALFWVLGLALVLRND